MDILKKIQAQPESFRKIVFWFLFIVLSVVFFCLWLVSWRSRVANFNLEKFRQELRLPELLPSSFNPSSPLPIK